MRFNFIAVRAVPFLAGTWLMFSPAGTGAESVSPWLRGWAEVDEVDIRLPPLVKVGVFQSRKPVAIGCTGRCSYMTSGKGKQLPLDKRSTLRIGTAKGTLRLSNQRIAAFEARGAEPQSYVTVNGRSYRGRIRLRMRSRGVIQVIEEVPLEHYVYGVLPREVGVEWPLESLKAQAVISRTFVLASLGKHAGSGYDVSNDVFSQVYGGLRVEHPNTNLAVDTTQGEILVDANLAPIQTFFHSSCGGRTETPQYVWTDLRSPPAYFESIPDPFCKEDPFYNWELNISGGSLAKRLRQAGYRVGSTISKVSIAKRSPSERAWQFAVESSRGRTLIPGNSFRLAVGPERLRSILITTLSREGKNFHFEGHGWGHGVGVCQWGARGRAKAGQSYVEILHAYYPRVRLVRPNSAGEAAGE